MYNHILTRNGRLKKQNEGTDICCAHCPYSLETEACSSDRFRFIDPPPSVIAEDNLCVFGKWLYGEEIPVHVKQSSEYEEVRQIHAQFHKFTAQIAMLAMVGEKEKARLMLEDGSEYLKLSDRLRSALIALARVV
jgi:hypothetical protein